MPLRYSHSVFVISFKMPTIPVASDIEIYFALSLGAAKKSSKRRPALLIVPIEDGWNDFGSRLRATLHLIGEDGSESAFNLRMLVEGRSSLRGFMLDILKASEDRPCRKLSEVDAPFASLLSSEEDYRRFVQELGFEDAVGCLRKLHDIVLARLENSSDTDADTLRLASTIPFNEGALRNDTSWTAMRQGGRHLSPNRPSDVDDAAVSFAVEADLRGFVGTHAFTADFGDDFPIARRSLVLVGRNGTGKTRLFQKMIAGLRKNAPWEDEQTDLAAETFTTLPKFSRLVVFSSVASDLYPASIAPWEGIDYRYLRMIGSRGGDDGALVRALVDCLRADTDTQGFGPRGALTILETVLEPLGIGDAIHVELVDADDEDSLPPPVRLGERNFFPLLRPMNEQRMLQLYARIDYTKAPIVMTGRRQPRNLSSGEVALLRFAAQAVASLRKGTIFLFDEPETHLHPNYISQFMEMLDRLLDRSGSIALIATHSAYIVREVPSRRVRVISRDVESDRIMMERPRMQTFGASIDTISQFVFGDIGPKHRFQQLLEDWIADNPEASLAEIRARFAEDLNPETLSYLSDLLRGGSTK